MHIEFKKVILHNFMSFGHSELSFEDDSFVRVSGINNCVTDSATSNGSGKSSLWESIIWVLTGSTIRGAKNIQNMNGDDGTYVYIDFFIDGKRYELLRAKEHKHYKTNLLIKINGEDVSGKGIRESEKLLYQYLPDLTNDLLGSVIILGQGLPQKFTNNTPSGRKEVLEKLSKSDFMIEDLKERVSSRKSEINDTINKITTDISSMTSNRTLLMRQIDDAQLALSSLNRTGIEQTIEECESQLQEIHLIISEIDKDIEKYNKTNESLNEELIKIRDVVDSDVSVVEEKYDEPIMKLRLQIQRLESLVETKSQQLREIREMKEFCPTCGQRLPDVHKPDTTSIENEIEETASELRSVKSELSVMTTNKDKDVRSIMDAFAVKRSSIEKGITTAKNDIQRVTGTRADFDKKRVAIEGKLNEAKNKLSQLDATIKHYNDTITSNNEHINTLSASISDSELRLTEYRKRYSIANSFDTALKRDFRGFLLSSIITFIQDRAKSYAKTIFDTDLIGFALNGNNLDISYSGKDYENLSGGEKQKVDLIVQFSIRDMLCYQLDFTSNILVLDEVFDGLDMIGCQRVIDMISSMSDIKNVYIVTHRKDLSIPTDKEIVVVKSVDGISELR